MIETIILTVMATVLVTLILVMMKLKNFLHYSEKENVIMSKIEYDMLWEAKHKYEFEKIRPMNRTTFND